MRFEIRHDFDVPLDAVELAVLSPTLVAKLAGAVGSLESLDVKHHEVDDGRCLRVWSFRANVPLPAFAKEYVTPDMCAWDERWEYSLADHAATWSVDPCIREDWKRFFSAEGTYRLESTGEGRSRRVVSGSIELRVPVFAPVAERLILAEVRKLFDAEARALSEMATLG